MKSNICINKISKLFFVLFVIFSVLINIARAEKADAIANKENLVDSNDNKKVNPNESEGKNRKKRIHSAKKDRRGKNRKSRTKE